MVATCSLVHPFTDVYDARARTTRAREGHTGMMWGVSYNPAQRARKAQRNRDLIGAEAVRRGGCESCGVKDERCTHCHVVPVFNWHHRDPAAKLFAISAVVYSQTGAAILRELEKCAYLCAECHDVCHI